LEQVDEKTQVARIAHTVGENKRIQIIEEAKKRNIRILNHGLKKAPEPEVAPEPEPTQETPPAEAKPETKEETPEPSKTPRTKKTTKKHKTGKSNK
jgi:hypothetical protein